MTPRILSSGAECKIQDLTPRILYIIRLWDKGLGKQEIMALTGIRKSETITRKISHRIPSVESVFESWYTEQWQ